MIKNIMRQGGEVDDIYLAILEDIKKNKNLALNYAVKY